MPLKLLIIENDRSAAAVMTQVFSSQGAEVQAVSDAASASVLTSRAKFDGIFLELNLTDMDGPDLTQRIRQSSWNSRTPIVLVSRNADAHAAARAFQMGGTFYLPLKGNAIRRALLSTSGVMFDERVRYSRTSFRNPIQCFVGSRELTGCVARNLSAGGMLFEGDGTLKPQERIIVLFCLAQGGHVIMARAVVVCRLSKPCTIQGANVVLDAR